MYDTQEDSLNTEKVGKEGDVRQGKFHRFISRSIAGRVSEKFLKTLGAVTVFLDRAILPLGFMAFATGIATYGGLFVSQPPGSSCGFIKAYRVLAWAPDL